ncbi:MAG: HPr family phosphocarrier protein [Blautia sp.]|nr:HPr family phosphocarrier protein [Blautia sp.]
MKAVDIELSSANAINAFLNIVSKFEDGLFIKSGMYMVNARSPIGIFACDLSKPVTLIIHSNEENILPVLNRYITN